MCFLGEKAKSCTTFWSCENEPKTKAESEYRGPFFLSRVAGRPPFPGQTSEYILAILAGQGNLINSCAVSHGRSQAAAPPLFRPPPFSLGDCRRNPRIRMAIRPKSAYLRTDRPRKLGPLNRNREIRKRNGGVPGTLRVRGGPTTAR